MQMSNKIPTSRQELPSGIPFCADPSILAQPISVAGLTLGNRIVYQPMEGCDGTPDGRPDELTYRRYLRFAQGGPGLIWFEASAVTQEGRANPRQMYLNEDTVSDFARLVEQIKQTCRQENGFEPIVICQLTHSGRYAKPTGTPAPKIAYSCKWLEKDHALPADCILDDDELEQIGHKLAKGAVLAKAAGFDGADIKCCHRYLLSELLSAFERPGRYGGSFANRTRLFRETVEEARSLCGNYLITSRLNIFDGYPYPYGFGYSNGGDIRIPDYTEAIHLTQQLALPLYNVTMGNPYFNSDVNRPAVKDNDPLRAVKRILDGASVIAENNPGATVICSGLSYLGTMAPAVAAGYIQARKFDLAGFGRLTLAYPDLARDILSNGSLDKSKICVACGGCTARMRSGTTAGCIVRDKDTYRKV